MGDSLGASFHTIVHHKIMGNYVAENYGKIYLANREPMDIVGIGDVNLRISNRSFWIVYEVKHVLKLMYNLILVRQHDDEGHNVTFSGGAWKFTKWTMVVARWNKFGTFYITFNYKNMVVVVDSAVRAK